LLAIASLIYVYNSGYFQASTIQLANDKHDIEAKVKSLEAEVKNFEEKKAELEERNQHLAEEISNKAQIQFQQEFIETIKRNKRSKQNKKKLKR
jgi:hypothetical protein